MLRMKSFQRKGIHIAATIFHCFFTIQTTPFHALFVVHDRNYGKIKNGNYRKCLKLKSTKHFPLLKQHFHGKKQVACSRKQPVENHEFSSKQSSREKFHRKLEEVQIEILKNSISIEKTRFHVKQLNCSLLQQDGFSLLLVYLLLFYHITFCTARFILANRLNINSCQFD